MMIAFRDPLDNKQIPFVKDGEKTQAWRDLSLQLDAGRVPLCASMFDVILRTATICYPLPAVGQVLSQQTGMWEGRPS